MAARFLQRVAPAFLMQCPDPSELHFDALNRSAVRFETFTYWLGVLSDQDCALARDADAACSAMSFQFDVEEQVNDVSHLREATPDVLRSVAPVTVAWRWSPFPAAFTALGEPAHCATAKHGEALAVFRPVTAPSFPASTADERHFQHLLRHCCERAVQQSRWVLLCGSPGWSYDTEEIIPRVRRIMARFGFVYRGRKPRGA